MGLDEWTISRSSDSSNNVFIVSGSGNVTYYYVLSYYAVRPVFYLNSNVTYVSGTGTSTDPIRID